MDDTKINCAISFAPGAREGLPRLRTEEASDKDPGVYSAIARVYVTEAHVTPRSVLSSLFLSLPSSLPHSPTNSHTHSLYMYIYICVCVNIGALPRRCRLFSLTVIITLKSQEQYKTKLIMTLKSQEQYKTKHRSASALCP